MKEDFLRINILLGIAKGAGDVSDKKQKVVQPNRGTIINTIYFQKKATLQQSRDSIGSATSPGSKVFQGHSGPVHEAERITQQIKQKI